MMKKKMKKTKGQMQVRGTLRFNKRSLTDFFNRILKTLLLENTFQNALLDRSPGKNDSRQ